MNSREFEMCLLSWITSLHEITSGQVIAIDGKTLRRSYDAMSSKSAIHMVSAWAILNHISLGQVVVDAKSNEITAIPKLLDLIDVSGGMVTIDAMGCQTEIIEKIVEKKADACIAVKQNQPQLYAAIEQHFDNLIDRDFQDAKVRWMESSEKGHDREESRAYAICPVPESVKNPERWDRVRAIGMSTNITVRGGKEQTEIRYYVLTRYVSGKRFADAVRSHWGIENSLHWQLDVTFREDDCRVRKGHSDANLSVIRRLALSMLKNDKSEKLGIKNKRLLAAYDLVRNRPAVVGVAVLFSICLIYRSKTEQLKQRAADLWEQAQELLQQIQHVTSDSELLKSLVELSESDFAVAESIHAINDGRISHPALLETRAVSIERNLAEAMRLRSEVVLRRERELAEAEEDRQKQERAREEAERRAENDRIVVVGQSADTTRLLGLNNQEREQVRKEVASIEASLASADWRSRTVFQQQVARIDACTKAMGLLAR